MYRIEIEIEIEMVTSLTHSILKRPIENKLLKAHEFRIPLQGTVQESNVRGEENWWYGIVDILLLEKSNHGTKKISICCCDG